MHPFPLGWLCSASSRRNYSCVTFQNSHKEACFSLKGLIGRNLFENELQNEEGNIHVPPDV